MEDEPASILLTEYKKWSELNDSRFMLLKAGDADAQGRFFINLSIDENKHFTLYCPMDYPNTAQDRFFVETVPCLWYWCNAINEYIIESKKDILLEDILNKAAVLYDTQETPPSSFSLDSEIKWESVRLKRLNPALNCRSRFRQPSEILAKEIFTISEANIPGIQIGLINGEINKWAVFLSEFVEYEDLNCDLNWLKATYSYDFIELHVVFALDAYPFHPPTVRIIRPRLQGISTVQISSLINCSTWTATCDLLAMLKSIKTSIGEKGRLDKRSERNDPQLYPQGVCMRIEHDLIALAWLMDFPFRVYSALIKQTTNTNAARCCAIVPVPERGTVGCCSSFKKKMGNISGWICRLMTDKTVPSIVQDLVPTSPLRKEEDSEVERLIRNIYQEIARHENKINNGLVTDGYSSLALVSFNRPSTFSDRGDACFKPSTPEENIFHNIEDSQFMHFIVNKLTDDNLNDICQHKRVYQVIIEILTKLKDYHKWSMFLSNHPLITASVKRLETETEKILSLFDWSSHVEGNTVMYPIQKRQIFRHIAFYDVEWCFNFNVLCKQYLQNTSEAAIVETIPQKFEPTMEDKYKCALRGLQVITCDLQDYCARSDFFGRLSASQKNDRPSSVMRVLKEVTSMTKSLPLELGSSIFVCSGESNCMSMRALIVGPEDTPYSNGCFMFDVFFPDGYPKVPPKLNFCTTGDGTVDFSPNLYSNGDVCLSLLGTSPGTGSELWSYHTSTLLQVLVSIQGLVLVPKPYFTRSENEHKQNTEAGEQQSRDYNMEVYKNTIMYAILPHLQRPDPCFKRILQAHFSIKKHKILQEVDAQLILNPSRDLRQAARTLRAYLSIPEEGAAPAA